MSIALELTVFNKLFAAVAEEMGIVLRRSAFSPNIKERQDYSCALFTAQGELLAQAAHIPVHLGALPRTMRLILNDYPQLAPGDVMLLNDPYLGGTHLPDLTLITPHYLEGGTGPAFYLVNRAHHADVGGMSPGSMPLADNLRQEGVIIPPTLLYRQGQMDREFWGSLLQQMRVPEERQGDLAAQVAALQRGQERLRALVARFGLPKLKDIGQALLDYTERAMRALIRTLPAGHYTFTDYLDDDGYGHLDLALKVTVTVQNDSVILDFREAADQVQGGVNTVPAVVEAACYYVFLALLPETYPINQGGFRPLTIQTRPGSILDARFPAAVAAGNVETSQRLVDVVLGALAPALPQTVPAASQGTMNNLAFGGQRPETGTEFTYYETIAGGMGGSPTCPGLDGVHTHMTNTQNTPVEVIEQHYPILVERYGLRAGSGGDGQHPGGQGICRDFQFLSEVTVSLLSERRRYAPYGLNGGQPGKKGENLLITPEGGKQLLPGKINLTLAPGTRLSIRTPGGGGWGKV
ncbi:MAG: hydantoinase B/oxoprolinase family protein [Deltaproteobacteria bacterium]|nr:MAG: hydantoinase B/oxoprolinase family protein [Deltaproteobacteria bacterium]